ncbi:MAG: hypothetical protein P8M70_12860 [Verrucomicrobiota bacterium]|nr:hypothetical protein [Verrucomicrobiota bacterium]
MRYFIVALVVSLCWLHQDWFVWPILVELNNEENFLSWLVAEEHEVKFGIPAGLGYQLSLSVATAAVAFLTVWKAWPSDLERWAEAGGNRDRNRGRGGRNRGGMAAYATWQAFKANRLKNDPNCIRLYTCDECVELTSGCKLPKAVNFRSQKADQAG